jgi:hypothetical protein
MHKDFTAMKIHVLVFRAVTLCSVVVGYQRFRGPCCLHLHSENVSVLPHLYTVSQPRRPGHEFSWWPMLRIWATGWTIGVLEFDSRRRLGIFLFTTSFRTALGPIQPPIQWVPGSLSLRVKRPWREADYSPPSIAEVKECVELYLHYPNTSSWHGT